MFYPKSCVICVPARNKSGIGGVAKIGGIWNVEKDYEKSDSLSKKPKQDDWITTKTVGFRTQNSKKGAA